MVIADGNKLSQFAKFIAISNKPMVLSLKLSSSNI